MQRKTLDRVDGFGSAGILPAFFPCLSNQRIRGESLRNTVYNRIRS
jgi:hypothetical protein